MIRGRSPPKHRHDGTSPLPLGIDWSPPPRKWNGRDTIWPHDPQTGWSYCVTIPSWVAVPKSRLDSSDPVVFYRVQVGIQSPAGVTTTQGVMRRFNDFLKLFSDLKRAFPKKSLPSAPPKGFTRRNSRALLEERKCSLEEWMTKLLSDIDISRSMVVASFLELEPAVRSSFRESTSQPSEANPSTADDISARQIHPIPSISALTGSTLVASDYGSDTAYETSELGSSSLARDDISEVGLEELTLDEGLTNSIDNIVNMSNIDEGLLMGQNILDELESFRKHKMQNRHLTENGNSSKESFWSTERVGSLVEEQKTVVNDNQKCRKESLESDPNSYRGNEILNSWGSNLLNEASLDLTSGTEGSIVLPRDQQLKLDRFLMIIQRRLVTAKTDMEDLLMRLNQEISVKDYLMSKVKDLEGELESTKAKSKENLQQALLLEKERITKMQWDMEELRQKSLEMELKLKSRKDYNSSDESNSSKTFPTKDALLQELEDTKRQLKNLLEKHSELEVKSKSDVKVLIKEVKSLRRSQQELRQELDNSMEEKAEVEKLLQQELKRSDHALASRRKLLHDCQSLQAHLLDSSVKFAEHNINADSSSTLDVLHLLSESDKQISVLLEETNHFAPEDGATPNENDNDEMKTVDDELRLVLRDIFISSGRLWKQMNLFVQSALQMGSSCTDDEGQVQWKRVLKQLLEQ